ncbi:hypothetical protein AB0436_28160 [Streptomyces sp. NPDC051322]|uniref:hypothetical protein n=1 Tax=Streptomyces sp. NPDC051322 TaxID=3154645 RepID=UPI00344B00CF
MAVVTPEYRGRVHDDHPSQRSGDHTTSTSERGSFCLARCTCGWAGPARRSRDRARADATAHAPER